MESESSIYGFIIKNRRDNKIDTGWLADTNPL